MKPATLAVLLMLPLAACMEVDVRAQAEPGSAGAGAAAPSGGGQDSSHNYYMYGQSDDAPDAQVNPGRAFNDYRARLGLPRLSRSGRLDAAAAAHARDVARMGEVTHAGSNGSTIGQRVRAQGYDYGRVAENVAWTARGFPTVMKVWNDSPGHRANLRLRDVTEFGLARSGDYWVLLVARPK